MPPDLRFSGRSTVLLLAVILAAQLLLSIPGLLYQNKDVDVLLYSAAAARANAEGALPYASAWIEKGPLAMGLFQFLFALFGNYNPLALASAWLALAGCGTLLVWGLARRMGAAGGAFAAASIYAVSLGAVGGSLNTEIPAAVLVAGGMWLWLGPDGRSRPGPGRAFATGLLVGAAFLCRQNSGLLGPLLAGLALYPALTGRRTWPEGLRIGGLVLAGFVLPFVGMFVVYLAAGELSSFWFCFYSYNSEIYIAATKVNPARLLSSPLEAVRNFWAPVKTASAMALIGMLWAFRLPGMRFRPAGPTRAAVLTVSVAALGLTVSLFVGFRFFSHYFALVLPLWAALGGIGCQELLARVRTGSLPGRMVWGAVILLVSVSLLMEIGQRPWRASYHRLRRTLAEGAVSRLSDPLHWPQRDGLAAAAAGFIREHSSPADRVFVWGKRPHVIAYADRIQATRFTTCTFLTGLVPWEAVPPEDTSRWIVEGAWDRFMEELRTERPLFIVDASSDHLFGDGAYAPVNFPRLQEFLDASYEAVLVVGEHDKMTIWQLREPGAPGGRSSNP